MWVKRDMGLVSDRQVTQRIARHASVTRAKPALASLMLAWLPGLLLGGCAPKCSPPSQLEAFDKAGPVVIQVDMTQVAEARIPVGQYRPICGDVLEFQMPEMIQAANLDEPGTAIPPYSSRVSEDGTICVPLIGRVPAAGKTLREIEAAIETRCYPKYLANPVSIVAKVSEYYTIPVTVTGAVGSPGLYRLYSDECSLVSLLMKAGGIVKEGAGAIRVIRPDHEIKTVPIPVRGYNVPFVDIALEGGETIEVEVMEQRTLTVVGLVNKPGSYPYPVGTEYNLTQGLALAGGMDTFVAPGYAKVYRQDANGHVVAVAVKVDDLNRASCARVRLRPGDIISVDHTADTAIRQAIMTFIRVSGGAAIGFAP